MILSKNSIEQDEQVLKRLEAYENCLHRQIGPFGVNNTCAHKALFSCETCDYEDEMGTMLEHYEAIRHACYLIRKWIENEKYLYEHVYTEV